MHKDDIIRVMDVTEIIGGETAILSNFYPTYVPYGGAQRSTKDLIAQMKQFINQAEYEMVQRGFKYAIAALNSPQYNGFQRQAIEGKRWHLVNLRGLRNGINDIFLYKKKLAKTKKKPTYYKASRIDVCTKHARPIGKSQQNPSPIPGLNRITGKAQKRIMPSTGTFRHYFPACCGIAVFNLDNFIPKDGLPSYPGYGGQTRLGDLDFVGTIEKIHQSYGKNKRGQAAIDLYLAKDLPEEWMKRIIGKFIHAEVVPGLYVGSKHQKTELEFSEEAVAIF